MSEGPSALLSRAERVLWAPITVVKRAARRIAPTQFVFAHLLTLSLIAGNDAKAQWKTWTGDWSADWNTATNWSPSGVPTSTDNVLIELDFGNLPILDSGAVTIGELTVSSTSTSGTNTQLTLSSGASLTTTSVSTIGDSTGSQGLISVSGVGTKWSVNSNTLYVGHRGSGELTITDGGAVSGAYNNYIGYDSESRGRVTVSGTGSQWRTSGILYVGNSGSGELTVENGGTISSSYAFLGSNNDSLGRVTVGGAGSQWTNSGILYVGNSGTGNLTIEDGGTVASNYVQIGFENDSKGHVTVTGAGSRWITSGIFNVGKSGSGELTIADGATVASDTFSTYIGYDASATGRVTVRGTGSRWTHSSTGNLYVGYDSLGELIITGGGVSSNTASVAYIGYNSISTGHVSVSGAGSQWANAGTLYVGFNGTGKLTIADGAVVTTQMLYASLDDLEGNGMLTASGAVLDGGNLIFDAEHGLAPTLSFGSGGQLQLTVDESTEELGAGYRGPGSLAITEGVQVATSRGMLGKVSGSHGTATIGGAGSRWTTDTFICGDYGVGELTILNGGEAISNSTSIGDKSGSSGRVTVSGSDSKLTSGFISIGNFGFGELTIADGGQATNETASVGNEIDSSGQVTIRGMGSQWTNSAFLFVGYSGSGKLTIEDAGRVSSRSSVIGCDSDSLGEVTVNGMGSQLIFHSLDVGYYGSGKLVIQNGGAVLGNVFSSTIIIGQYEGSTGNVTVTGTGSQLVNSSSLYVGYDGFGELTIKDGGTVSSASFDIGLGGVGRLTVSGAGSRLTTSGTLDIGFSGSGEMIIEDGGAAFNRSAHIGRIAGSTGYVTVTGAGSEWTNSNTLFVGDSGSGELTIANGGMVSNISAFIGYDSDSTGQVSVSGTGSHMRSSGILYAGYSGNGSLTVTGGLVTVASVSVAANSSSIGLISLTGTEANRGTLSTGSISKGNGSGKLSIDGGTLQARSSHPNFLSGFEAGDVIFDTGGAFFDTQTYSVGIPIVLDGAGGLSKEGSGTLTLSASNTYNGATTVSAGILLVNGNQSVATGSVTVFDGATLGGTGIIGGATTVAGTLSPGAASSIGTTTFSSDLTLQNTATAYMELGSAISYDHAVIGGTFIADGTLQLVLAGGYNPALGTTFDLFDFTNLSGEFTCILAPSLGANLVWDFSDLYTMGQIAVVAIPEPSTSILLTIGSGLALVAFRRRKR